MSQFAYDFNAVLGALLRENHLAGDAPFDARQVAGLLNIKLPMPCKEGAGCRLDECCRFVHPGEEGIGLKYLPDREYMDFQTGGIYKRKAAIQMVNANNRKADFYLRIMNMTSWESWCFIKKIPYIPYTPPSEPSDSEAFLAAAHWDAFRDLEHIEVLGRLRHLPVPADEPTVNTKLYNKVHGIVEQIKDALVDSGWRILNRANRIPKNLTCILTQEFMDLTHEDLYKILTDDSLLAKKVLDGVEAYWLQPTAYTFATR